MKFIWGGDELGFYPPMIFKNTLKGGKMIKNKKAQMSIGDAPAIVLIVGLLFLTMATVAVISDKYGDAIEKDNTIVNVVNETGFINSTTYTLATVDGKRNYVATLTQIVNTTDGKVITAGNYTFNNNVISNATAVNWNTVKITYTYSYSADTTASNLTRDLNTELGNNSSIAGIILTISLVGIILGILVVVFFRITRRSNRL
jgi:hypothetical protein